LGPTLVIRPVADFDLSLELVSRTFRDVVDVASRRVASVQRALRTLQYFDAVDVEEAEAEQRRGAEIDIVDVNSGGARLVRLEHVEPDAADREDRETIAIDVLDGDVRAVRGDVFAAHHP